MHACQLQYWDNDFKETTLYFQYMRLMGKEQHDLKYGIQEEELAVESVVLLYDTGCKKDMSQKLLFKWLGLYMICDIVKNKGIYILKELDRLCLASTFAYDRPIKFHSCQALCLN